MTLEMKIKDDVLYVFDPDRLISNTSAGLERASIVVIDMTTLNVKKAPFPKNGSANV